MHGSYFGLCCQLLWSCYGKRQFGDQTLSVVSGEKKDPIESSFFLDAVSYRRRTRRKIDDTTGKCFEVEGNVSGTALLLVMSKPTSTGVNIRIETYYRVIC